MRLFSPCFFAGWFYPGTLFRIKTTEKLLFLTFDDGPDPGSTLQVLNILVKYKINATFFCNGRAAKEYPDLINKIKSGGNLIGNHGYNHLDGWKTSKNRYVADVENAAIHTSSVLFRPPYGHLRINQYRELRKRYKIIFWDLMPYDYDESFGSVNSLKILFGKLREGSVIALHDKKGSSVLDFLDEFINTSLKRGYRFSLPNQFSATA
jgi:peptidoglycan/xylan/chitin deacetylase (PgdA/CDA1 family)